MRFIKWGFGLLVMIGVLAMPALAAEVTISCGAVGEQERRLCVEGANAWARETGNTVVVDHPPDETNRRYLGYIIELGDQSSRVDVYQIDVIWPGLMAKFLVDLKEYFSEEEIEQHHSTIVDNNTVEGRLVGMPWFTDVGLLYYRKDLLDKYGFEVPEDWSEMADVALIIQEEERKVGMEEMWGYVFQGGTYEGLTVNALEWIYAYGGGTIVDEDGNITINNPQAITAVDRAGSWVGTISHPRVIYYLEEDARRSFQLGNAVFMRNWPYAWALLSTQESAVAGKVGIAPLPKGGPRGQHAGALGGWQLAVSKYSENPEAAADLVRFLTSRSMQKRRAIAGAFAPTIMDLYEDPEILEANPFFADLRPILETAVARPAKQTGQEYMAVSSRFWDAVHDVLIGEQSARNTLVALEEQLRLIRARGGEGW